MFIEINELKTVMPRPVVDIITNMNEDTVNKIIRESIKSVSNYLYQFYDVTLIFSATGEDRDDDILKHLKIIIKYALYGIRDGITERLEKDYNESLRWLEKVSEGKIRPDLPMQTTDDGRDGSFLKTGSRPKYSTGW